MDGFTEVGLPCVLFGFTIPTSIGFGQTLKTTPTSSVLNPVPGYSFKMIRVAGNFTTTPQTRGLLFLLIKQGMTLQKVKDYI
tara:strand:- start:304 stop:549 length:246 start_codon:yes stop_codon:yes gene_type:complete